MSNPTPTGQDEARRALDFYVRAIGNREGLADCIASALAEHPNSSLHRPLLHDKDWRIILAALRAPSQDRGAEDMRKQCLRAVRSGLIEAPTYVEDALCSRIEAAIRALPVPADLNEGGGNASR